MPEPRIALVVMSADELQAQRDADRRGRAWAADYPTAGDVLQARMMAAGERPQPTEHVPWGPLQIRELATGLAIGGIGFKSVPDGAGSVEIGYGIAPSRQGRGIASEAVAAVLELARRHGARVVRADTDVDNLASARVLTKNGFVQVELNGGSLWWERCL